MKYEVYECNETGEHYVKHGSFYTEACDWYSDGGFAFTKKDFDMIDNTLSLVGEFTNVEIENRF